MAAMDRARKRVPVRAMIGDTRIAIARVQFFFTGECAILFLNIWSENYEGEWEMIFLLRLLGFSSYFVEREQDCRAKMDVR